MIGAALIWNHWAGIRWEASAAFLLTPAAILLPVCLLFVSFRRLLPIAEIIYYVVLFYTFTFFAIRLTYLCLAIGFPLQDQLLAGADAAIGFDWLSWADFLERHPLLSRVLAVSYGSIAWQPVLAIPALALLKPRIGNAELFMALFAAMVFTLVISTFVPAIGPGDALGFHPPPAPLIRAVHATPTSRVFEYRGVVTFPSFHTVTANLLVYACRNNTMLFCAAIGLNALMLASVPFCGDHYLADMLAGGAVAMAGVIVSKWLSAIAAARAYQPPGSAYRVHTRQGRPLTCSAQLQNEPAVYSSSRSRD